MKLLEEIEKLLLIDRYNLDEMCCFQAEIFYHVAEEYSKTVSLRDAAKEVLLQSDAELAISIRRQFELDGEKVTETRLQHLVLVHQEHQRLFNSWLELKLQVEKWGALKEAFVQRASMLKLLCELHLTGYYSDIEIKGDKNIKEVESLGVKKFFSERRKVYKLDTKGVD